MSKHEQLRIRVKEMAEIGGFGYIYHTWNSRHSPAGFPDMLFLDDGRFIVVELKIRPDNLSAEQYYWLLEFTQVAEVYVWDDSEEDWEQIKSVFWRLE